MDVDEYGEYPPQGWKPWYATRHSVYEHLLPRKVAIRLPIRKALGKKLTWFGHFPWPDNTLPFNVVHWICWSGGEWQLVWT